ncbi:polysaccharide biosynthesis tyrosine autokinase [Leifsonia sp. fls2-241-R2A-40a]|uniref:polysaccharide biosynthesis tyrosine autokinase n=1 Tax=Leifsonia sp. fls2-241-R2A-40a TaxID=3040290 RepID=UPI00254DE6EA|nr:polysaccharide biosynthesis tyrosine autokinase [Leifsonia sp. fls2-241-R2A-40a]
MTRNPYLALFRHFWYVVVAGALIGAIGGWGLSQLATREYTSTTSLYFSLSAGVTGNDINQGSTYTQNQMLSFAQLATAPVVLQPVIDSLDLSVTPAALAKQIAVTTPQNTVVLQLDVTDTSAKQATDIANAAAASLRAQVEDIAPKNAQGNGTVTTRIIEPAVEPVGPSAPNERLNILIGLVVGILIAAGGLLLWEAMSTRVDSEEKTAAVSGAPSLGTIRRRRGATQGLAMVGDTRSSSAEDFRQLRANLEFVAVDVSSPVFVLTSSILGEGKSTVATNLAIALSEGGRRVLLIDADLRRPAIARYTGLVPETGLSTILAGRVSLADAVQPWGDGSLTVLTAGRIPPNPSELLSSRAMSALIAEARTMYDVIVIDTPPLAAVADAASLVPESDATVVVVDRTAVRRSQLVHTVDAIRRAGGSVAGTVLNKARGKRPGNAYYYYQLDEDAKPGPEAPAAGPRRPSGAAPAAVPPRSAPAAAAAPAAEPAAPASEAGDEPADDTPSTAPQVAQK